MEAWDDLLAETDAFLQSHFYLDSPRDQRVWQYVIGVAAHLEYCAVAVLWVANGAPGTVYDYRRGMTLGQAVPELRKRALLDGSVLDDLRAISDLRNEVVHRSAVFGLTRDPRDRRAKRGLYKGRHVFSDPVALRQLANEASRAAKACYRWIETHAGEKASRSVGTGEA